jgi:MerR family transcriptional regulator, thiopeptide resistance regulator
MPTVNSAIALLVYEDIPAAHDFLVNVFGFVSGGVQRDAEGRAVHGEVQAGPLTIWLHRVMPETRLASPRSMPANASGFVIGVDDVDEHFRRAKAGGAGIDGEPRDMPYGVREYGASDPEGHRWWFIAPLKK